MWVYIGYFLAKNVLTNNIFKKYIKTGILKCHFGQSIEEFQRLFLPMLDYTPA
ncbi:hypothetical protein J500_2889 [Acinetobacter sp. 479375]|nr:hypothetical protein J500_2889 [Acinetobacter sp. 479375]